MEYLLTGDAGAPAEATVIARNTPIAADVLKVGHHGSKYSSTEEFLAAVHPVEAVIQVGDNPYGHPTEEVLARLQVIGARIWRTDQYGTVVVNSNGTEYRVNEEIAESPQIYLPLILYQTPPATPTPSVTPTPTDTPRPTATPTWTPPTPTPPTNADVIISYIFYDGVVPRSESDEYAEITNNGSTAQNLQGWRLNAGDPGQDFIFPSFELAPGQSCRVYTDEYHPEYCGFSFGSGSALWRNSGDCGYLYDGSGALVDDYCY